MLKRKPLIIKIASALCLILLLATQIGATQATPPPPAPILLVTDATSTNKFGPYLAEILRAEGLNAFEQKDKADLSAADLSGRPAVILAEMALDTAKADMLTSYVNGGGHLLAMRPAAEIKGIFGLGAATDPPLADGYLKIETNTTFQGSKPGQGLVSETLQLHTAADRYAIDPGTVEFATLYADATTSTVFPAVAGAASGSGWGVAFTYDLATNVILIRQGNPANKDTDFDDGVDNQNIPVVRTIDLFHNWLDIDKTPIPQADEQQRFFARLVRQMVEATQPMPQIWYFPETAKTMLVLTADSHGNPTTIDNCQPDENNIKDCPNLLEEVTSISNAGPGANAKMTFYVTIASDEARLSYMQAWQAQGFGFGIHPYAKLADISYPVDSLSTGFTVFSDWFTASFPPPPAGTIIKSRTVRTHQVAWDGWVRAAEFARAQNLAMDTSFYHWGQWLKKDATTWAPHGYITGSGQPMKFIDENGNVINVFQQLTSIVDEDAMDVNTGLPNEGLTSEQAFNVVSKTLIDASNGGDYAALTANFHVDYFRTTKPWVENTISYAKDHNVPLWNADRWLAFTETRHDVDFTNLAWDKTTGKLTFDLNPAALNDPTGSPNENLSVMLPMTYNGLPLLSVKVGGVSATPQIVAVKGENRGFVSAPAGQVSSFEVVYGQTVNPPFPTPTPDPLPFYLPLIKSN